MEAGFLQGVLSQQTCSGVAAGQGRDCAHWQCGTPVLFLQHSFQLSWTRWERGIQAVNYNSAFPSVFIPGVSCSGQSCSLYLMPSVNPTHALLPPPFTSDLG